MAFIQDFWKYCACYEVTRNNAVWSAFSVLGAAVNRKVYTYIGDIYVPCNLYTLLVSEAGSGKSTARNFAYRLHQAACPEIRIGASKQSHGDIIKQMSTGDCTIHYTDQHGKQQEASVYTLYIDEFKNFIAYDMYGMLAFLTGIHSAEDKFDASTLARNVECINYPSLTVLACENPDTMVRYIKTSVISDGFGRRVNIVYETEDALPKPEVIIPPDIRKFYDPKNLDSSSLVQELKRIKNVVGEYTHTPESRHFYNQWYTTVREQMKEISDPVYRGWKRTQHIQLLKLAMLYDVMINPNPSFKFSVEGLNTCSGFLQAIEPNMPKLFQAGGRNELALPQQQIVEMIRQKGGMMTYREVDKFTSKDLSGMEFIQVIDRLVRTTQLYRARVSDGKVERDTLFSPEAWQKAIENGIIKKNGG
jgi:uncharacterized protein DUF3987